MTAARDAQIALVDPWQSPGRFSFKLCWKMGQKIRIKPLVEKLLEEFGKNISPRELIPLFEVFEDLE